MHSKSIVEVDKKIWIIFWSLGPMSLYIHELMSWYKTKRENSRNFEISLCHT